MAKPDTTPTVVLSADDPDVPGALRSYCNRRMRRIAGGELPMGAMADVQKMMTTATEFEAWYKANGKDKQN